MAEQQIRFDDGASYEQMMGIWSRSAGEIFLDWLVPPLGLRWIDIGCGNGAFTELLVERCSPSEVQGIDPSEGQLALHVPDLRRAWQSFTKAMPWPFLSQIAASMRL
jgi:ubiquinone/menaquinone biosynthesis C-methylase UbiE